MEALRALVNEEETLELLLTDTSTLQQQIYFMMCRHVCVSVFRVVWNRGVQMFLLKVFVVLKKIKVEFHDDDF